MLIGRVASGLPDASAPVLVPDEPMRNACPTFGLDNYDVGHSYSFAELLYL